MKEKYKKSKSGDAILVDDGTDWNLVAALYGYNGRAEQDAPGVAERAALFVAAPNLLERAEAAEARVAQLEAERNNYKDAAHDWHMNYLDAIAVGNELRAKLEQTQSDLAEYRTEVQRLTRKIMTAPHFFNQALNEGDGSYRP